MAASFARGIQRGEAGIMTHVRVACPPRGVAMRFGLARRGDRLDGGDRCGAGPSRARGRGSAPGRTCCGSGCRQTGQYLARLTAAEGPGRAAHDQAQVSVNPC